MFSDILGRTSLSSPRVTRVPTLSWSLGYAGLCQVMSVLAQDPRPSLGFIPTQRRSVGGRGWSSRWSYSCFLPSCPRSVCSGPSTAEPAAPGRGRGRRADSRAQPGRKNSHKSECSRTGSLKYTQTTQEHFQKSGSFTSCGNKLTVLGLLICFFF